MTAKETRRISAEYTEIGDELIRKEGVFAPIRENDVTIVYLASDKQKKTHGRLVYGECEKVQDKYQWGIPADFTVTVFEPNCKNMDAEHVKRVIFHELLHVGIGEDKDGNPVYSIIPHDLEDFRECVGRWGTDWQFS